MEYILHIGGNKTASTLLQRKLFSSHNSIYYLGEDCINYNLIKQDLNNLIHEDDYEFSLNRISKYFKNINKNKKVFVFSNEDIMGSRHPSLVAKRLKLLMPKCKVVIVVRNQITAISSWYVNHGAYLKPAPKKYWRNYVSLDDWLDYCFKFPLISALDAMNYQKYYSIFSKEFGDQNISIFCYEDLIHDKNAYYEKWSKVLKIDKIEIAKSLNYNFERKSITKLNFYTHKMSGTSPLLSKIINSLLKNYLHIGPSMRVEIPTIWKNKIIAHFSAGNSFLNNKFKLNLEKYNYPLI